MAQAESDIETVIMALNVRLRNHDNLLAKKLKYTEYPLLKSGISTGGYIAQFTASFADLFDSEPANVSSFCHTPMPKMSFTIFKDAQFRTLKEKNVTWGGGGKDDGTIESTKSQKSTLTEQSTTDVT